MTFPGRFAESLVVEHLDKISLSFLVEDLQIKRGGIAPNICFGLAALGLNPLLVGAVGEDFGEYRAWLDRHGVLTWPIHVSETRHTARFVCTTDADNAQIGSFYTGAMAEARQIELKPIADRVGGLDLVIISPERPGGDAAAHRRVPLPELPLHRRPVPADGLAGRTGHHLADRRSRLPVLQRLRGHPDHPEDGLVARRDRVPGRGPGDDPRASAGPGSRSRARIRSTSRSPRRRPSWIPPGSGTPSGPGSSPGCPGVWRRSAARRSARCSPAT